MSDTTKLHNTVYAAVARLGMRNPADYRVSIGGDDALAVCACLKRLDLCEKALRAILTADSPLETAVGYEMAQKALEA
jgi:hypothetical protein